MEIAICSVRRLNPAIKAGVCSEHGGDTESTEYFHSLGVDYVSEFPSRLRVAVLAVGQVSLRLTVKLTSPTYEARRLISLGCTRP